MGLLRAAWNEPYWDFKERDMSPVSRTINAGSAPSITDDKLPDGTPTRRFDFSANGQVQVRVKVKPGKTARAKTPPAEDPSSQKDFTLKRLAINLEVPGGADTIEIEVKSPDAAETKLAYYFNDRWNIISQSKTDGFFKARVSNWPDDPSIGLGN
jgi:hypothetical protein